MKLILARRQAEEKGLLGGSKGINFILAFRVELTPDEESLVSTYKAEDELVAFIDSEELGIKVVSGAGPLRGAPGFGLKVRDLLSEQVYQCSDVTSLLQIENTVKESCERFKTLLEVMKSFGGKETIEY